MHFAIVVSCYQSGKSLNLCDELEHLLCGFSTYVADYLPRQPILPLALLASGIAGLHARGS